MEMICFNEETSTSQNVKHDESEIIRYRTHQMNLRGTLVENTKLRYVVITENSRNNSPCEYFYSNKLKDDSISTHLC